MLAVLNLGVRISRVVVRSQEIIERVLEQDIGNESSEKNIVCKTGNVSPALCFFIFFYTVE